MTPQPLVLSPAEGEEVKAGPFTITSRVQGPQSGGLFEMYELSMGAATIDYHVHHEMDETLYVLEGEIRFNVAGETFLRPGGSVAFVPRGVHHGFSNPGPDRARVLIVFTPARNQHEYFRILAKLFAAPALDAASLETAQREYDQQLVPVDA
jgi:quercetin dioxygenase-like cupin family protein